MSDQQIEAHVDAGADLITRLGEELFTDSLQALLELVKNSYDADAQRVVVIIERNWRDPRGDDENDDQPESAQDDVAGESATAGGTATEDERPAEQDKKRGKTTPLRGRVLIIDEGSGMDDSTVERGWLVISTSRKREEKARGELTELNRTPLGDKGLGRLGAQRLATVLMLRTRPRPDGVPVTEASYWAPDPPLPHIEHEVTLDFREFRSTVTLREIPVTWVYRTPSPGDDWPADRPWGTVLELRGLKNIDDWLDEDRLRRELSRLINPYARMGRFQLTVTVDGNSVDPERIGRRVRDSALATYTAKYDGQNLVVTGKLRSQWIPGNSPAVEVAARADKGAEFVRRVQKRKALAPFNIRPGHSGWLLEFERVSPVEQIGNLPSGEDCGPFEMELDQLSLELSRASGIGKLDVFSRQKEYREWVADHAGVPIYRDGFHVAPGSDLLRLGESFTAGGSWYGLRPQNVLGYIAISAAENRGLQETTDREDFRNTPAFRRFRALLSRAREDINRALDDIGREVVAYNRELRSKDADLADLSAEDLAATAKRVASDARRTRTAVASARDRAASIVASPSFNQLPEEERKHQQQTAADLERATVVLQQVERLAPVTDLLAEDVGRLEERYRELYETTGLGIVAEALVHDIAQVVHRLQERARMARRAVKGASIPREVSLLIDEVDAAARALRGQLRHLDPQMRGARTRREELDLGPFLADLAAYHRERLSPLGIEVRFRQQAPATVYAASGRLAQVIDNLVINSEYWLQHGRRRRGEAPVIAIAAEGPRILVSDNGPGVPPAMAESIFEPFVSNKAGGRGLGLFIARQLLDTEQAIIALADQSGKAHNTFVIDLSKAVRSSAA